MRGNHNWSELVALLFSLLLSVVFLAAFVLLYKPGHEPVNVIACGPTPASAAHVEVTPAKVAPDPNDRFRGVPENFAHINFQNWRYGQYRFGGEQLDLVLTAGEQVIPRKEGGGGQTFSLIGVLYSDVTGDGKPEAIVRISHVQCGGSCDGGSDLFYIYQSSKSGLRRIWMYETGSMAYGCGLKSFTLTKKQIVVEMFGQCWEPASSFETSGKFMVRDVTRSVFHFNGKRFVKRLTEITAAPVKNLRSHTPEVNIQQH